MKHGHYSKNVSHLSAIDVYRVLSLFGVTDQAIGHAIKKLLCPGQRGAKTKRQDIQEAIDTLERWRAMEDEDLSVQMVKVDLDSPASVSDDGLSVGYKTTHPITTVSSESMRCSAVAIEPASLIDEESPRMQAIGQNGNGGEHYAPLSHPIRVKSLLLDDAQHAEMFMAFEKRQQLNFIVTEIQHHPEKIVCLEQVIMLGGGQS